MAVAVTGGAAVFDPMDTSRGSRGRFIGDAGLSILCGDRLRPAMTE